jgi:hypothetical protein
MMTLGGESEKKKRKKSFFKTHEFLMRGEIRLEQGCQIFLDVTYQNGKK